MTEKRTVPHIRRMKDRREKIAVITCYDYPSALLLDQAEADILLVGDSLGNNVLGFENTIPVTLEMMIHHARAVRAGTQRALLVADMPFMSYQISPEEALHNAGRLMKEAGADTVKVEGGAAIAATVRRMVDAGIPVMGHIGLTPQSLHVFGGYKIRGKDRETAEALMQDACALADAGAYAIVLELLPPLLARRITESIPIPTIGIGAGPHCDGQVQVFHDLFGLYPDQTFRHAKRYFEMGRALREAASQYVAEVRSGVFPAQESEK